MFLFSAVYVCCDVKRLRIAVQEYGLVAQDHPKSRLIRCSGLTIGSPPSAVSLRLVSSSVALPLLCAGAFRGEEGVFLCNMFCRSNSLINPLQSFWCNPQRCHPVWSAPLALLQPVVSLVLQLASFTEHITNLWNSLSMGHNESMTAINSDDLGKKKIRHVQRGREDIVKDN